MTDDPQWIEIYRETLKPLYGFVSRRAGGDRELAEDVTQEAWLRAVRTWGENGLPDEPLAWLKTVSRNLLANYFRRRKPVVLDSTALETLLPEDTSTGPATSEAAAIVQRGLSQLDDEQAKLIEAVHIDGLGLREIAREIGLSERAIEGRLYRARRALGDVLQNPGLAGEKGS